MPRLGGECARRRGDTGVPDPHDFTDGYQPAFWRRPDAYLDPAIRAASSTFATLPDEIVEPAMRRLQADLASVLGRVGIGTSSNATRSTTATDSSSAPNRRILAR